jgi:PHD/YefM family antitoxin component YafN of YafNO toxin-antitoxin module
MDTARIPLWATQLREGLTRRTNIRILCVFRELRSGKMTEVTATEFAKAFGRYKEEAQREPVAITSYGRVSGYFVSAREYEELRRLRAFERRVYRIKDLPTEIAEAIQGSRMNPAHDHLDALMDEK